MRMFFELMTAATLSCSGGDVPPALINQPDHQPGKAVVVNTDTMSLSTDGGWPLIGWSDRDALASIPARYFIVR